jgi:hypothetical protein
MWEETISEFHRNIKYNINMDYVLVCTHHKLILEFTYKRHITS